MECIAAWRPPRIDYSMPGGFVDRALTLADCQAACAQRYPHCVAINVVPLPSGLISCYLVPEIQQLVRTANTDYYQAIISDEEECQVVGKCTPAVTDTACPPSMRSVKRYRVRLSVCPYVRPSVRPSVYPSMGPQQKIRCCGFPDVGPAGRRYRSIAAAAACGGRMRAVPRCQRTLVAGHRLLIPVRNLT